MRSRRNERSSHARSAATASSVPIAPSRWTVAVQVRACLPLSSSVRVKTPSRSTDSARSTSAVTCTSPTRLSVTGSRSLRTYCCRWRRECAPEFTELWSIM
jgi:hypothetical protein